MQPLVNKLAKKILGKKYSVSFAFISDSEMHRLNKKYRKKDKTTDILSFNLEENVGEILISKKESSRKAKIFDLKPNQYLEFILIHGLLHLKGLEHGAIMEEQEKKFCKMFDISNPNLKDKALSSRKLNATKNNSRNRHRHIPGKSSSRPRNRG